MPQVAVVTDTTAYLPSELVTELGVTLVPLYVVFGPDRVERESDITDYPAFFEELRGSRGTPDHLAALGRRLPRRLRAAARRRATT